MSWDIFVQDIPEDVQTIKDMHDRYSNFKPKSIGRCSEIIAKIKEIIPNADFSDPSWGIIDGPDYSIEVNIGEESVSKCSEDCYGFTFHVRGGDKAAFVVSSILQHLGLHAFDPSSETGLFKIGPEAIKSFKRWRRYKDQVLRDSNSSLST